MLVLTIVTALTCFSLSRLVSLRLNAKNRAQESLVEALHFTAQRAILEHPSEDALKLLLITPTVPVILRLRVGPNQEFTYAALIDAKGALIAETDPHQLRGSMPAAVPIEALERAFWPEQLFLVFFCERRYELRSLLTLSNQPFAEIITGLTTSDLRRELRGPALLNIIFALTILGIALLVGVLSSPFVLRPLRDVVASIEQLEAESVVQDEALSESAGETYSIAQRLRALGQRFAGNRTELEMTRDQLRQVIGSLSERIVLLDRDQRVLLASPEAERLLANGRNLSRGRPLSEALGPHHPLTELTAHAYSSGQSLQKVATFATDSTEPQMIAAAVQIFEDREGLTGALLALRDPATLEQLESQLDFATKLAALNRITAGMAHEVKNPLHAMVLHLELLNAKLAAGKDPRTHVEILASEVQRLNRVVQTFLDFNRPLHLHPQVVDASLLVREVLPLAANARAQGIEFIERYAEESLPIKVDADLLKQALLNIIINGCQAMPEGGRLTIETTRLPEKQIQISLRDEGAGIPTEAREKIFNLYYTTKLHGSGIGLAQAFRAVQLHNGRIEVESEVGAGTCFRIILPMS